MENYGERPALALDVSGSVQREVAGFFKEYPFLLVDEKRLAVLLCRPIEMVSEAVRLLEEAGFLARRDKETLTCISEDLAAVKSE